MTISANVRFRYLFLDAIAKTDIGNMSGRFYGKGVVAVDDIGITLDGRRRYRGGVRFVLWLLCTVIGTTVAVIYFDYRPSGFNWLLVPYFSLAASAPFYFGPRKKERITIRWNKVTEFARGVGRNETWGSSNEQVMGISFSDFPLCSPAIFEDKDVDSIYDFVKSAVPDRESMTAYEAIAPQYRQQECPNCSAPTCREETLCKRCGETLYPSFVLDDDANRHILKIQEMLAQDKPDKDIATYLKEQKETCLINNGKWTDSIVEEIRERFSLKRSYVKQKNGGRIKQKGGGRQQEEDVDFRYGPRPNSLMEASEMGETYAAEHRCQCGGKWVMQSFDSPIPGGISGMPCVCNKCGATKHFVFRFW